ncbi:MAG: hypothetical protein IPL32_18860 [Chloracidobacterium sp.]|nr:hypothetical protein [Chloracidobacterium sp.]
MNSMTEALDTLFPSIFDDEDNVYNTDQLGSEVRPSQIAKRERAEASTRTDTPSHRRS